MRRFRFVLVDRSLVGFGLCHILNLRLEKQLRRMRLGFEFGRFCIRVFL